MTLEINTVPPMVKGHLAMEERYKDLASDITDQSQNYFIRVMAYELVEWHPFSTVAKFKFTFRGDNTKSEKTIDSAINPETTQAADPNDAANPAATFFAALMKQLTDQKTIWHYQLSFHSKSALTPGELAENAPMTQLRQEQVQMRESIIGGVDPSLVPTIGTETHQGGNRSKIEPESKLDIALTKNLKLLPNQPTITAPPKKKLDEKGNVVLDEAPQERLGFFTTIGSILAACLVLYTKHTTNANLKKSHQNRLKKRMKTLIFLFKNSTP